MPVNAIVTLAIALLSFWAGFFACALFSASRIKGLETTLKNLEVRHALRSQQAKWN